MHLAYVLLSITVVFLILYLVLGRYIKAWLNKRRRLSKLHQSLSDLEKRKEDLISLSTWAEERGDKREARMIESDLKTVDQDIENVKLTIESVTQLSILHPGYESL
ncbi:hypothetical protein WA171_006501 [Blastocystis sp. BT1]